MARFDRNKRSRRNDEPKPEWIPKSDIGRLVKTGQITSLEEINSRGKPILESGIVDHLYPDMTEDTLEVKSTQRMTGNGRKMQFRAIVLVGDKKGHFGIGAGKSEDAAAYTKLYSSYAKQGFAPENMVALFKAAKAKIESE